MLERAAVIGREFSRAALAHLLPRELRDDLDARLDSLRRSELIEPDGGRFVGEPALRFHHALVRDAAYRRLLKGTRADLHARVADWLESRRGEAVEHEETIGLAPRAGPPASSRAGPARRARARPRRTGGAASRGGGPAGPRARRPSARGGPARTRTRSTRGGGAGACRAPARPLRGAARGRRRRAGRARGRRPGTVRRPARRACVRGTPASPGSSPCSPIPRRCAPPPMRWRTRLPTSRQPATPAERRRPTRCTRSRWRASARSAPRRPRSIARSPPRGARTIGAARTSCSPARRWPRCGDRAPSRAPAVAASTSCACSASRRVLPPSRPSRCAVRACSKRCADGRTRRGGWWRHPGTWSRSSASRSGSSRPTFSPA